MATKAELIAELQEKGATLTGSETMAELRAMLKPIKKPGEKPSGEKPVGKPAQPEQRSGAKEEADFNKSVSDMKSYLAEQPKVELYVPLDVGEDLKAHPIVPVTINGYRLNVPKGVRVQVPKPVADIIFESLNIYQDNSGNAMLADRDEVKEGISVQDALS